MPPRKEDTIDFDAADWYWFVGDDEDQVYSSAAVGYVPVTDSTYVDWLTEPGHGTSRVVTEQDLWDYLNGKVYNATPPTAFSTDAAKDARIKEEFVSDLLFQIAFNHENRIRARESLGPLTQDAFIASFRSLLK